MNHKPKVSDYDHSDYSRFWTENQRQYDDRIERKVVSELLPAEGDWFADFGCAHGRLADIYMERFRHCVFVDYSTRHLNLAKQLYGNNEKAIFVAADIYRLPFRPKSFNAAMMVRVLHHLEEPSLALREVAAAIMPSGRFLMNYRNRRDLRNMLRALVGLKNVRPFRIAHDNLPGCDGLQAFTHPKIARQLMEMAGFRIMRTRGTSFFGGKLLRIINNPVPLEAPLSPLLGALKLSPLIFIDAKLEGTPDNSRQPPSSVKELLACPDCKIDLEWSANEYRCRSCNTVFKEIDGIFDFRKNC